MAGLMRAALRQMQTDLQSSILQSMAASLQWHNSAEQIPKAFIGHIRESRRTVVGQTAFYRLTLQLNVDVHASKNRAAFKM